MCVSLHALSSSFSAASGDGGASNKGHGNTVCTISPLFPASSPWVTTVSATLAYQEAPPRPVGGNVGEAAVCLQAGTFWTTGGGFSNSTAQPMPWYQRDAVQAYLTSGVTFPPSTMFEYVSLECCIHLSFSHHLLPLPVLQCHTSCVPRCERLRAQL
jgi:subtilase family serine protease